MSKISNETEKKIQKRVEKRERRLGRELKQGEVREIRNNELKVAREKHVNRVKLFIAAVLATIGIGGVGVKSLSSGNSSIVNNEPKVEGQANNKDERNTFLDQTKVDLGAIRQEDKEEQIDYDKIMMEILETYNSKNNTKLTLDDLSFIRTQHRERLGIDKNGTYIFDYYDETPVEHTIENGKFFEGEYISIGNIYSIINKNDKKIITSLAEISEKIKNIDTKAVMDYDGNEYFESDKKIDLTENKNLNQIKQTYQAIENQYERVKEQQRER